jgi:hypothetical protein
LLTLFTSSSFFNALPESIPSEAISKAVLKSPAFPDTTIAADEFIKTISLLGPLSPRRTARVIDAFSSLLPPCMESISILLIPKSSGAIKKFSVLPSLNLDTFVSSEMLISSSPSLPWITIASTAPRFPRTMASVSVR